MNNSNKNDDQRFKKLYELLGDEVNTIYSDKELFSDNNNSVFDSKEKENNNVTQIKEIEPTVINSINQSTNENTNENVKKKNDNTFRNNVLIDKNFDAEDESYLNKNKFVLFLTNKKFLLLLLILIFICVCIVVFKAFYYGKKVDHYEEFFTTIESKEEDYSIVYDDQDMDSETLKKVAASELVNCVNAKIDEEKIPDSIKNIMNEINSFYNQSYDYFAFLYRDIYTGFTVSYNQNQNIFTASTIKAPTDIYIYEMASQGKVNLDDELTYTGAYYNTGSGVLKNKSLNTKYSVRTLLEYSTVYSDNAAHNMLMDNMVEIICLSFGKIRELQRYLLLIIIGELLMHMMLQYICKNYINFMLIIMNMAKHL